MEVISLQASQIITPIAAGLPMFSVLLISFVYKKQKD